MIPSDLSLMERCERPEKIKPSQFCTTSVTVEQQVAPSHRSSPLYVTRHNMNDDVRLCLAAADMLLMFYFHLSSLTSVHTLLFDPVH